MGYCSSGLFDIKLILSNLLTYFLCTEERNFPTHISSGCKQPNVFREAIKVNALSPGYNGRCSLEMTIGRRPPGLSRDAQEEK